MDLERRVEALEKELQILKAQIQTTLLDIQEQILTNAYPTLRAENAAPQPERPASNPAASITVMAANPGAAPQPEPSPNGEDSAPVNVRKVSINDFDEPPLEPPTQARRPREEADQLPAQDLDLTTLSRLEAWATEKLDHMGVARTKQLIRMYAEQGRFTPDVEATLLKFVSIYEETTGPLPSMPGRRTKKRAAASQPPPAARKKTPAPSPEERPTRAKKSADANPALKTVAAEPEGRKKSSGPTAQAKPPAAPNKPSDDDSKDEGDPASVVLKLIAGIQNAGVGVQWRKKDG